MDSPLIGIRPVPARWIEEAVVDGGGQVAADLESCRGLVWNDMGDVDQLRSTLDKHPSIEWVQLPSAGVERVASAGVLDDRHCWTCAKGAYRDPVAEHALLLALAGLRMLPERVRATTWGSPAGTSLFDSQVTIIGGGGISASLLGLLAPFRARATVVRRSGEPMEGASRTLAVEDLAEALHGALVVFLALALTPATTALIGKQALAAMDPRAWLVNVARGKIVDTEALCEALETGAIAGAALDVTDPEPLPDDHRLWSMTNCILTPHTADTPEMIRPLLAARIAENVRRFGAGEPLVGAVDPSAGY